MTEQTNSRLKSFVERLERLNEERSALSEDLKDVYLEVKSAGYTPKILRKIIAERKRERSDVQEEDAILDLYKAELGMLPLFEKKGD